MVRRLLIVLALCATLTGALGGAAHASSVTPPPYRPFKPQLYTSAHFAIHYEADPTASDYITQVQAGVLASYLEQAYTTMTDLGYQPPVDDSITTPGLIDYYVVDLSQQNVSYVIFNDGAGAPTSGTVDFGKSEIDAANEGWEAATSLFVIDEFRYWTDLGNGDDWAAFGPAQWFGFKALSYPGVGVSDLGPVGGSLDCNDPWNPLNIQSRCSTVDFEETGQSHWTFWEYLTQRFGPLFPVAVFQQQNSSGSTAIAALQAVLTAQGTSFDDAFHDWSVRTMIGGWNIPALDAAVTPVAATISTGATSGNLGSKTFSIDHLASRYIAFTRGDNAGDHPCFQATLTITVGYPSTINARPVFYWNVPGTAAVELTPTSSTSATATLPWDTCVWANNKGLLSLTNSNTTYNAALFTVTSSLSVDTSKPASATSGPTQLPIYGGQTTVPTGEIVPSIDVFGPLVLQVSASSPVLRLIVESSGDGVLHAVLGSVDLGSPTIRAGNNDLRFTVPKTLLTRLRRASSAANLLMLTPTSVSGAAVGTAVSRQVAVIQATKPAKKAAKHKKK
jgi:hypothetical protein